MIPAPPKTLTAQSANLLVASAVCISLFVGFLSFKGIYGFTRIDHFFYDQFVKSRATEASSDHVTVIDIDDVSLATVGQWPWPRYKIAELISKIAEMDPLTIGLDIIFPEQDRTSLTTIQDSFKNDFGIDLDFQGVPKGLTDNDGYLGHVMASTGTVGARYFYFDHAGSTSFCRDQGISFTGRLDLLSLHKAPGILCNTPKVERRLAASGFINTHLDDDGMLRRVPLLIKHDGIIAPNLSLSTVLQALDVSSVEIEESVHGPIIRFGPHNIPITRDGYASLRFKKGTHTGHTRSAVDVFNGTVRQADIDGKIVFIGSSAAGLNDLVPTVLNPMFPGIQTHAVLVDNILEKQLFIMPDWADPMTFAVCIFTGLLMGFIFIRSSGPLPTFMGTLVLCFLFITTSYLLFATTGLFFSPGSTVLTAACLFALLSSARYAIERQTAFRWFRQLANTQLVTMESMANVAETRDPETGAHIKRTQHFVKAIAEELRREGHFRDILTDEYITQLYLSAPLHDIGKVGVPDNILLKPGKLTDEEFKLMKQHAEFGHRIIENTVRKIEGDNFLKLAGEIAYTHHEKWDGTGYPQGLEAEAIPLSGRIMITADIYDALTSERCYKPPFSHEKAKSIMEEERAGIFDPVVFDAFLEIEQSIIAIAENIKEQDG